MQRDMVTELSAKVMTLSELLWENRINQPLLKRWLANFTGVIRAEEVEQAHALYLLSRFLYFGDVEIRFLLRSLFDDLVRQPLSMDVRAQLGMSVDEVLLHHAFMGELHRTRFCGIGGISKSGPHMMYPFRQENDIPEELCCSLAELVVGDPGQNGCYWADESVHRVVMLDDFCATGEQAIRFLADLVPQMRELAGEKGVALTVWYFPLVATTRGLTALRDSGLFNRVEAVASLDDTYRLFDDGSQFYLGVEAELQKADGEAIVRGYGQRIDAASP